MFGVALLLSIAGLLVGPAITSWASGRFVALRVLDAAMLGVVLPLLLLRLVPHLVDEIGAIALAAVAIGYAGFAAIEARTHANTSQLGAAILLPTLAIHSFLDGAALAVAFEQGATDAAGATFGAALVLHRIPEGLVLASALIPKVGFRGTMIRVAALAATTLIGALLGRELLDHTPDRALHVVVAVGLGVMLRMVVHGHDHDHDHDHDHGPDRDWLGGLAFLVAGSVAVVVPAPWQLFEQSQPHELSAVQAIVPLFVETAPWMIAALLLGELFAWRRGRIEPPGPVGWLASGALAFIWLGPPFAIAAVTIGLVLALLDGLPIVELVRRIAPPSRTVIPAYVAGIAIAVIVEAALPAASLDLRPLLAVPLAAIAGWLVPIGIVGTIPIAAIAVHKGVPIAAAIAFVWIELLAAADRSGSWVRAAIATAGCAASAAVLGPRLGAMPRLHELGRHLHPYVEQATAIGLCAWIVIELARRGPRRFLGAARRRHAVAGIAS